MFYIYVLQSDKNNELYIGFTSDLKRRIVEHNQGLNFSAKRYTHLTLIYNPKGCQSSLEGVIPVTPSGVKDIYAMEIGLL